MKSSGSIQSLSFLSPIGRLRAVASDQALWYLGFADEKDEEERLKAFLKKSKKLLLSGINPILQQTKEELETYFCGDLQQFTVALDLSSGTSFQQAVWLQLLKVPYGSTRTYAQQAAAINRPSAYRAVANANGANNIPIILPCHRIVASDGTLGGYSGGVQYKRWLLDHEKRG